ncbi:MAG: formylglycine-generating enzyme family protein [bacterium]|nr:formylglycine-generating enzyme family protein [bacterium]
MAAKPVVTNVAARQQALPSFVVDIHYDVADAGGHTQSIAAAVSTNAGGRYDIVPTDLAGDIGYPVTVGTNKHVAWNAYTDLPAFSSATVRVRITADDGLPVNPPATGNYCVIDISAGPTAAFYPLHNLASQPVLTDGYQTTKILLRRIPAGIFVMGSPSNELGRGANEGPQHTVTLLSNFYMGVFEITQAQYSNVMGSNPAYFPVGPQGPKRPVEQVSWNMARGGTWPDGGPSNATFIGRLRSKTGLAFDLPTEAQWEYACRAGTTNALNNNTNLASINSDPNMNILGRYWYNGGSVYASDPVNGAHTVVGSYRANNWGLYDMHGNVGEWCLDWYGPYTGDATDPAGAPAGTGRVISSGGWGSPAKDCRSAIRFALDPATPYFAVGFRLSLPADQ